MRINAYDLRCLDTHYGCWLLLLLLCVCFQAEDGIRDLVRSRGLGDVYKRQECTYDKARGFAFEVHVKGKAIVFNGPLNQCLKVSSVLEEIALHTQIIT